MNLAPVKDALEHRIEFDPNLHATFSTRGLEAYAFKDRKPVVIDLMNVVAAVEYADRSIKRSSERWGRVIHLVVGVYEFQTWRDKRVHSSLIKALRFLTGDEWQVEFVRRRGVPPSLPQSLLELRPGVRSVMPFSDGLDSRAVAAILRAELGDSLQLVSVGSVLAQARGAGGKILPFTRVPYRLNLPDRRHSEPSARSRGLKFSVIAGIAAYLSEIELVTIPESGQGMFGPALTPYMHAYPDYRCHPRFLSLISDFLHALLGKRARFEYPRLWSTKGETVKLALEISPALPLAETRSCWMKQNLSSHHGTYYQCGVCAACLLRRMSFFVAGVQERVGTYLCDNLNHPRPSDVVPIDFDRANFIVEYAVAGASQMFDFSRLEKDPWTLQVQGELVAPILGMASKATTEQLAGLVARHSREWSSFVDWQGPRTYLRGFVEGEL